MNIFNSLLLGVGLIGLFMFSGCSSELRRDSAKGYRVRSNEVYWGKLKIDGVEADSFEIASVDGEDVPWATDATRVYYRNLVVEGADPNSFKVLDKDWACDRQFVFRGRTMNRQVASFIVGTERGLRVDRQVGFDSATLRIAHRGRHETWFADKDHVYFDSSGSLFSSEYVIESADPETFHKDPESSYWMDKNFVFGFGTKRIGDTVDGEAVYANPNAWRCLPMENGDASKYFTDDRFIWRNGRILKGANPQTFRCEATTMQPTGTTFGVGANVLKPTEAKGSKPKRAAGLTTEDAEDMARVFGQDKQDGQDVARTSAWHAAFCSSRKSCLTRSCRRAMSRVSRYFI